METYMKPTVIIDAEEFNRLLADVCCLLHLEAPNDAFKAHVEALVTEYMMRLGAAGLYRRT